MGSKKARRLANRELATEFVTRVNAETVCAHCGEQPIEWHHEDHPNKPNSRVSSLRAQGASIARIQAEMDKCEPLCRSCHMKEDGRLNELQRNRPQQKGLVYVPELPCEECGKREKPLRRKRCYACYNRLMDIRQPVGRKSNGTSS